MTHRVLVTGDRWWIDEEYIFARLDEYHAKQPIGTLIEGCARGVDSIAEKWARSRRVQIEHYPANWDKYRRAAGPIRNQQMINTKVHKILAFHPNLRESKGTWDMIGRGQIANVGILYFDGTSPTGRAMG